MRNSEHRIIHEAVLFFDGMQLVREMRFEEFDAVVNRNVGILSFANNEYRAAFVRVDQHLDVIAVVLFLVSFDSCAHIVKNWNIPLQHMADVAGQGPDLGVGPIGLACRGQCPVPWHQSSTWDPDAGSRDNCFVLIQDAMHANALGFQLPVPTLSKSARISAKVSQINNKAQQRKEPTALPPRLGKSISNKAACSDSTGLACRPVREPDDLKRSNRADAIRIIRQLRLHVTALGASCKSDISALKRGFRQQSGEMEAKIQHMQQVIESNEDRFTKLKNQFVVQNVEDKQVCRDAQISKLQNEVDILRQEKQRLLSEGAGKYFDRLKKSGVTFVVYHPGVGHLAIALADTGRYLESPLAYIAEQCSVTPEHYSDWLEHYNNPVCTCDIEGGHRAVCLRSIPQIDRPADFISGYGDRCSKHIDRQKIAQKTRFKTN